MYIYIYICKCTYRIIDSLNYYKVKNIPKRINNLNIGL